MNATGRSSRMTGRRRTVWVRMRPVWAVVEESQRTVWSFALF